MKRVRRGRAVRIHVADEVGQRGQLEPFDERAAFADGLGEFQRADGGIIRRRRAARRRVVSSVQPLSTTTSWNLPW